MRIRAALPLVASLTLVAQLLGGVVAHAGEQAPDLPPADRDVLARMFDPQLEPLGLRTTRAALQDPGGGYATSPTGRHLAIYVEPIAEGDVDRAVYVRNIMKTARIFLPYVYKEWSDLESFDICQEPEPIRGPQLAPPPVTQLVAERDAALAVRWKRASLADFLRRAEEIGAKRGQADPLYLVVSPRTRAEPAYQRALRVAGVDEKD
jgi:hypothetical protein